jgi:hypothetical protein
MRLRRGTSRRESKSNIVDPREKSRTVKWPSLSPTLRLTGRPSSTENSIFQRVGPRIKSVVGKQASLTQLNIHAISKLARQMIERAKASAIPFAWVAADALYGNDADLRTWLEDQGLLMRC